MPSLKGSGATRPIHTPDITMKTRLMRTAACYSVWAYSRQEWLKLNTFVRNTTKTTTLRRKTTPLKILTSAWTDARRPFKKEETLALLARVTCMAATRALSTQASETRLHRTWLSGRWFYLGNPFLGSKVASLKTMMSRTSTRKNKMSTWSRPTTW